MPAMNTVPDRAEYAIVKPPCKGLNGSAAVGRRPTACTLLFILGVRHRPRQFARQSTPIAIHAKDLPFPEVARKYLGRAAVLCPTPTLARWANGTDRLLLWHS